MLAVNAALIATAFGLYYIGHEALRRWTGTVHTTIGLGLPALLAIHVWLGRRRRVEPPGPAPSQREWTAHSRRSRRIERRRLARTGARPGH